VDDGNPRNYSNIKITSVEDYVFWNWVFGQIWKLGSSRKMFLMSVINERPSSSKTRWHTDTAFVGRLLTSEWRSTARLHSVKWHTALLQLPQLPEGALKAFASFLNVPISHPFRKEKLLGIFTEIK
jgi:hypothetical protein